MPWIMPSILALALLGGGALQLAAARSNRLRTGAMNPPPEINNGDDDNLPPEIKGQRLAEVTFARHWKGQAEGCQDELKLALAENLRLTNEVQSLHENRVELVKRMDEIAGLEKQLQQMQSRQWLPFAYLSVEDVLSDTTNEPHITYKNKLTVVLKNDSGNEIQLWSPLWDVDASEVKCQWPLGTRLRLLGKDGKPLEEQSCVTVGPSQRVECWIGLMPPIGDSIKRRIAQKRNGVLIFPIKTDNKLRVVQIKV